VPGVRQGEQAAAQAEKDIPPPLQPRPQLDFSKLSQDADELAKLAQTIPPDVTSIQRGMLPKDMSEKLKRIEKLSKHLRSQIGQ
jgi:chemotaxis response regulator CheB